MKIFVIPSVFPSSRNFVSGVFVLEQCLALKEDGHEITVLFVEAMRYKFWLTQNYEIIEKYSLYGIRVYYSKYRGLLSAKLPRLALKFYNKKLQLLFNEAIKEIGMPDVMHSHFTFTAGIGTYKIFKKTGIPYIVTEHSSLFLQESLNSYIRENLSEVIRNSQAFICVSVHLKNAISKLISTNRAIEVIPNMLDDRFTYFPVIAKNSFIFYTAGNLVKSKNFLMLVDSFCEEFGMNEPVQLIIGGEGPEKTKILKKISSLDRKNQIHVLGQLTRESMLENYQKCDCFVLTSKFETFGIVYREAMAVGRPIISSKNGGIEEEWDEKFGILLESNDIENCRKAMRIIFSKNWKYDSKYISAKIRMKYSKEKYVINMTALIDPKITQE